MRRIRLLKVRLLKKTQARLSENQFNFRIENLPDGGCDVYLDMGLIGETVFKAYCRASRTTQSEFMRQAMGLPPVEPWHRAGLRHQAAASHRP